ncbi:glycosyltransferase [Phaeovulum sp. W22_SRMD_FR3]|uniref:glycosyltransferase n=1 Tax=Phaeovulum sp. W22_SRMD_FR3 TaxID=3240274 RepID=UPI003F9CC4FA
MSMSPEVTILMALHNAGPYLQPQLHSMLQQTMTGWSLLVGDDGATDGSVVQVEAFARQNPQHSVQILPGPRRGFAQNFLALLRAAGPDVPYVALADHDDVWLPEKLTQAVARIRQEGGAVPVLYCARTMICDAALTKIGPSPIWPRPFSFANALVQNVAAGNTIVLNRPALDLVQKAAAAADHAGIIAHDWWLYQLIIGAGGRVVRDDRPVLLYRQHARNLMGRNDTLRSALVRSREIRRGVFRDWIGRNIAALAACESLLTPENARLLREFAAMRQLPGAWARVRALRRLGLYRQTRLAGLAVWLAAWRGLL